MYDGDDDDGAYYNGSFVDLETPFPLWAPKFAAVVEFVAAFAAAVVVIVAVAERICNIG